MGAGAGQTTREWYRPLPPYAEVEWSLRNNTNYMETGVLSALELTAAFPKVVLENFYRKSRNSIESGKKDAPFGYVIPAGGRDQTRVAWVVNILRMQGIEVGRATSEVRLKDGSFPAGSFIVKRDQPYGRLAKILLEKQSLPRPEPPHLRRHRLDDGAHDEHRREGDRRQGDPRRAGSARDEGGHRRNGLGRGRPCRGDRPPRLGQHDHAAIPPEGPQGQRRRAAVQGRRRRVPGRLVRGRHRRQRRRARPGEVRRRPSSA